MRKAGGTTVRGVLEAALVDTRRRFAAAAAEGAGEAGEAGGSDTAGVVPIRSSTHPHRLVDDGVQ